MPSAEIEIARPQTWRRWFAFLGAGVAWTAHLLSIYAIGEFGCVSGLDRVTFWSVSAVAWLIILVTILCLLLAAAGTIVAYRDKRRDGEIHAPPGQDEGGEYLSSFGFILSALFTLIILVESLPVFAYLEGC
jgi:hypothetical protein